MLTCKAWVKSEELTEMENKNENLLMPSVCGMGLSQLEMTFCGIHTCDLGKS